VLPLDTVNATLQQQGRGNNNFSGTLYVATPVLLADFGIKPGQVDPGADIMSMRPGLSNGPRMQLIYGDMGPQGTPGTAGNPTIQELPALPSGTSAPNTVITSHAIGRLRLQTWLDGWFIQAPKPLTSAQIAAARQIAANAGVSAETKSGELGLNQISDGATVLGLVIALGVLVMSVGLVRSETDGELRTLSAVGASSRIRRTITGATAGAIGLLGAVLGGAGATIAGLAWARSSLSTTFGDFPVPDLIAILAGLPLIAAAGGWLLAGRQPAGDRPAGARLSQGRSGRARAGKPGLTRNWVPGGRCCGAEPANPHPMKHSM
jgi:putative ABC transport system permease protein